MYDKLVQKHGCLVCPEPPSPSQASNFFTTTSLCSTATRSSPPARRCTAAAPPAEGVIKRNRTNIDLPTDRGAGRQDGLLVHLVAHLPRHHLAVLAVALALALALASLLLNLEVEVRLVGLRLVE